jgi:hypothetical protein
MWDFLSLPMLIFAAIGLAVLGIYNHHSSYAYTEVSGVAGIDSELGKRGALSSASTMPKRTKTTFRAGDYLFHILPLSVAHYLSLPSN